MAINYARGFLPVSKREKLANLVIVVIDKDESDNEVTSALDTNNYLSLPIEGILPGHVFTNTYSISAL